jgi:adenylylsulfate kinase
MAGLPGTGKSTLARRLAQRLPESRARAIVLDKDVVRAALFPADEIEYSTRQDDFCVDVMLRTAAYLLSKDPRRHVILDGRTFSRRYQVEAVRAFANEIGVPCAFIECRCPDSVARQRLARDVAKGRHLARNRTCEMYLAVKARAEPIAGPKLVVNTDGDLEQCVQRCLAYIQGRGPRTPDRAAA